MTLRFLLNDEDVATEIGAGVTVFDYLRGHRRMVGTKIGCREGDCGACTVLVGTWHGDDVRYRSMTSCLMPLGNAHGKHLVTIEGLNLVEGLTPAQQAMCDEGASQCGFCTVGFVVSLAGHALDARDSTPSAGHCGGGRQHLSLHRLQEHRARRDDHQSGAAAA